MPAPPFYLKLLSGESVMLPSRLFPLEFWWIFVCWCLQQGQNVLAWFCGSVCMLACACQYVCTYRVRVAALSSSVDLCFFSEPGLTDSARLAGLSSLRLSLQCQDYQQMLPCSACGCWRLNSDPYIVFPRDSQWSYWPGTCYEMGDDPGLFLLLFPSQVLGLQLCMLTLHFKKNLPTWVNVHNVCMPDTRRPGVMDSYELSCGMPSPLQQMLLTLSHLSSHLTPTSVLGFCFVLWQMLQWEKRRFRYHSKNHLFIGSLE